MSEGDAVNRETRRRKDRS